MRSDNANMLACKERGNSEGEGAAGAALAIEAMT
jgi:hypothetical protein